MKLGDGIRKLIVYPDGDESPKKIIQIHIKSLFEITKFFRYTPSIGVKMKFIKRYLHHLVGNLILQLVFLFFL